MVENILAKRSKSGGVEYLIQIKGLRPKKWVEENIVKTDSEFKKLLKEFE